MTGPGEPAVEGIGAPQKPAPIFREDVGIHAVLRGMGERGGVKDRRIQGFCQWGGSLYSDGTSPPSTKLPITTIRTGWAERYLNRRGVHLGRVRGDQPGIGWSPLGGERLVKVHCR